MELLRDLQLERNDSDGHRLDAGEGEEIGGHQRLDPRDRLAVEADVEQKGLKRPSAEGCGDPEAASTKAVLWPRQFVRF